MEGTRETTLGDFRRARNERASPVIRARTDIYGPEITRPTDAEITIESFAFYERTNERTNGPLGLEPGFRPVTSERERFLAAIPRSPRANGTTQWPAARFRELVGEIEIRVLRA